MPPSYAAAFDEEAHAAHAAVSERRGDSLANVEIWRKLEGGVVAVCIAARDRPGLLATVSAAVVGLGIDVVSADAFRRVREDGTDEAVDILYLRRAAPPGDTSAAPIEAADIARIGEMVEEIASERRLVAAAPLPPDDARSPRGPTRIRFDDDHPSGSTVLTVEATDRPGLLLVLTTTLFGARLQVVGLHATTEEGRAVDRFEVVDLDGAKLRPSRRLALQSAIFEALEAAREAPPDEPPG
jgi:[protein-PII] uridylyltransferase